MRRNTSIGSMLGILLTCLLFIGLGIALWFNRGLVFSPGKVSAKSKDGVIIKGFASHAEFEKQCSNCHDPFTSNLADKCLDCHIEIEKQITLAQGIHSQLTGVYQCASCHPDHQGKAFDPTKASFRLFDHSSTGFSLNHHLINFNASPMECAACHKTDSYSIVDNQTCLDCHSSNKPDFRIVHTAEFGNDCLGCHDGVDQMTEFSHDRTGYPLEGLHQQAKCTDCHSKTRIGDVSNDCKDCHAEPIAHIKVFELNCKTCHTLQGWSPASLDGQHFAHLTTTGFSLTLHKTDYSNQPLSCATCHTKDLHVLEVQTCIDCHSQHDSVFMSDHQQQFGTDCMTCHDGVDRLSNYDHQNFFILDGKHAELQCTDCHTDNVYRGTPTECYQCHEEPEIHADVFGQKCSYCHTTDVWSPATLRQHNFPVNHGSDDQSLQLTCDACHGPNYIDYTCYSCHDHQPDEITQSHLAAGIAEQDIPKCVNCHPNGKVDNSKQAP